MDLMNGFYAWNNGFPNNGAEPKDRYRIILTDEDENDLRIEESDEEPSKEIVLNKEPSSSKYNGKTKNGEFKKYGRGRRKSLGAKRQKRPPKDSGINNIFPKDGENNIGVAGLKIKLKLHRDVDGEGNVKLENKKEEGKMKKRSHFSCHHCSYISWWKTNLEKHMMAQHTGERPFRCTQCEYSSVHQFQLEKHYNARHFGQQLNCIHCPFTSDAIEVHLKHMLSEHTADKPHQCAECGRRSMTLSALELHILDKHRTVAKSHSCPYCDYSSVLADNLNNHIEALHKCSDCEYRSDSLREVRRHKKVKHRSFSKCDQCDYIAKSQQFLRRHLFLKHSYVEVAEPPTAPKSRQKYPVYTPPVIETRNFYEHSIVDEPKDLSNKHAKSFNDYSFFDSMAPIDLSMSEPSVPSLPSVPPLASSSLSC